MDVETRKVIGGFIAKRRKELRYKQKDLSEFLGCHYASISMWEGGHQQIPLKHFIHIPILLECKLEDLIPKEISCRYKK